VAQRETKIYLCFSSLRAFKSFYNAVSQLNMDGIAYREKKEKYHDRQVRSNFLVAQKKVSSFLIAHRKSLHLKLAISLFYYVATEVKLNFVNLLLYIIPL
jgi:hypothetical protein